MSKYDRGSNGSRINFRLSSEILEQIEAKATHSKTELVYKATEDFYPLLNVVPLMILMGLLMNQSL